MKYGRKITNWFQISIVTVFPRLWRHGSRHGLGTYNRCHVCHIRGPYHRTSGACDREQLRNVLFLRTGEEETGPQQYIHFRWLQVSFSFFGPGQMYVQCGSEEKEKGKEK